MRQRTVKTPEVTPITHDEWLAALECVRAAKVNDRPPGSVTVAEKAREWGWSKEHTRTVLNALVDAGKAEVCGALNGRCGSKAVLYRLKK